jgi:hypothetical protein
MLPLRHLLLPMLDQASNYQSQQWVDRKKTEQARIM